jgi:hypothetical protein
MMGVLKTSVFGTATLILAEKPGLCRFFQELVPKPCAFSAQSISFGTSSCIFAIAPQKTSIFLLRLLLCGGPGAFIQITLLWPGDVL